MKVLGIDPGSKVVGYGALTGLGPADVLDGGKLTPADDVPCLSTLPEAIRRHVQSPELAAYRRTVSLVVQVAGLIREVRATWVVVEIPSGLIGTGAKRGARGSLTTYGLAAGMILEACRFMGPAKTVPVTERQWTAGRGNKRRRQQAIAAIYGRRYNASRDPGGDVADAIGIVRWWLAREQGVGVRVQGSGPGDGG